MNRNSVVVLVAVSLAACQVEDKSSHRITAANILEQQRRYEAELHAEMMGPPIAPYAYRRLTAAVAFNRERQQMETARYARFQLAQKIALAQATSANSLRGDGEIPSDYRQAQFASRMSSQGYHQVRLTNAQQQEAELEPVAEGPISESPVNTSRNQRRSGPSSYREDRVYPARFYQRQMQEDSAAQAEATYNETSAGSIQQQVEPSTPVAIPVPGRPGFVTMGPNTGRMIDVRGYAPGSYVMDPWTKAIIRVP